MSKVGMMDFDWFLWGLICLFLVIVSPLPELLAEDICLDPTRQKERIEELKRYDIVWYDMKWYDRVRYDMIWNDVYDTGQ